MAKNYRQQGDVLTLPVTPGKKSGDWDMVGDLPVGLLSNPDENNMADCRTVGVFTWPAKGTNDAGNSAVAIGDTLYADGDELNKDAANGKKFGTALDVVPAGQTTPIPVRLKG